MWKRTTATFLASQTLSLFGSSLVQYALLWYVTLETKSGTMLMLYIVCGFLPTFFLSPFGGVWADRYDRKKLIMLADGLIALVTLALAIAFMLSERSVWLVMVAAALRAVGAAIQGPAVGAILPQFVPQEYLARVNGIAGSIHSLIALVSPLASGVLISLWPMQYLFFIDVVTAALAITVLLFFLHIPPHAKALSKQSVSYFADMKIGFRYIKDHRYLVSFFSFLGVLLFLITPAAFLTPLQVARTFGSDVWRLTAIEITFSAGMIVGGGIFSVWGGLPNRMHTMLVSTMIMGICTVTLGMTGNFWFYLTIMWLFGVAMPFLNTPSIVFVQEHVEEDFLGRVFSVNTMLFTSMMPLGMLFFGPLAEIVTIESILIVTGILMVVQSMVVVRNRGLIKAGVVRRERLHP